MDHEGDLTADGLPTSALSFVTPPGATPEWLAAEMAATHGPVNGQHSHSHPAYGSQGDDKNHDHLHAHAGDSHHGHDHSMKTPARAEPATDAADATAVGAGEGREPWTAAGHPELGSLLAGAYAAVPEGGSLVAAAMEALGSPWGVEQRGGDWALLGRDGEVGTFSGDDGYGLALDALREHAFADQEQRPVLTQTWRSDMAFEGVKTPDGRQIDPGGFAYRDCPMPMMLQTTTDMGHYGAVLAGTILSAGTQQQVALGSGEYDDTEAGRYALQIVEARGRFGVSIDGMSPVDAEAEIECDDDGWCSVVGVIFHLLTIGGLCYSDDTEVLSEHGWVRFADLPKNERVATRNPKSGAFEWQEPVHYTNDQWNGKMIRFAGQRVDMLVTPNHRMLVKPAKNAPERFMRADELAAKTAWGGIHNYGIPATSKWDADDVRTFRIERPTIADGCCACGCGQQLPVNRAANRAACSLGGCERPSYGHGLCNAHYQRQRRHGDPLAGGPFRDGAANRRLDEQLVTLPGHGHGYSTNPLVIDGDTFAAFMGAWLAEGSLNVKSRQINLSQMPESRGFEPYRRMLIDLIGREPRHTGTNFVIRDARLLDYLRQFGHAADKFVPMELKNFSARQLRVFFDHYMLGDGHASGRRASTVSRKLADDIQEVAQKIGLWAKITRIENTVDRSAPGGRIIKAENCQDTYQLDFYNRPDTSRTADKVWAWDVEEIDYDGMVRCVTVPNESLYVRRNGKALWCGNTMTPWPAFPDAYIALEQRAQAAAGDPEPAEATETPCEGCDEEAARARAAAAHVVAKEDPTPVGKAPTVPFTAAAVALLRQTGDAPPAEWYRPQGEGTSLVAAGDDRLIPQDDAGHVAVPLTIEASGRFYSHVASWFTCHTSFQGKCVVPPRSRSGYAAFNLRPMECADGTIVSAGSISMGCGHASTDAPYLSADEVRAHYDGGPGAVRIATVAAGQDEHGPWIAGCVDPDRSEAELNRARTLNVSGDWREVWRNKGLDLVAVLAGVLVPGFPIRSALSASGLLVSAEDESLALPGDALVASAADDAERIVALVAAGVVRRPWPWEPTLAAAMGRIDRLEERLAHAERVTSQLRPLAASAIAERVSLARQPASNGTA